MWVRVPPGPPFCKELVIDILITVLVIAFIAVITFWIVDKVGLPDPLNWITKSIIGICALIALNQQFNFFPL